ncbi:MAG: hypothetical protein K5880_03730 [Hydrogenophaga sp.]|uniref:hypothetical protein n=1 Tax=Hydrogenophaga sp. TaxID=1904254 RepID=UPI0026319ED3|nr:hypothetical protein [Hydrogenophaga sp.]MCV0437711.1 hypothetical protein [Hydrogenophaga sp.]
MDNLVFFLVARLCAFLLRISTALAQFAINALQRRTDDLQRICPRLARSDPEGAADKTRRDRRYAEVVGAERPEHESERMASDLREG